MDWKTYLESIYTDPKKPGSFSGPEKLYATVKAEGKYKIGLHRIKKWLKTQEPYTLTHAVRRKIRRNEVVVEGLDSQWDCDLMDMGNVSQENDGYKFGLIMIDIFSRFLWIEPLKRKTGSEVAEAMKQVFDQGRKPLRLRSDKGKEFVNKQVQSYLKEINVHHFVTQNEPKANYAERVIKTIKMKIFRFMLSQQTHRYIDNLQHFVDSYNGTLHSSLGQQPKDITPENEDESRLQQYLIKNKRKKRQQKPHVEVKLAGKKKKKKRRKRSPYRYKIGDLVRVSHTKALFDREYQQKWTGEIFKVSHRYMRDKIPVYKLDDWQDEPITGTFYTQELQGVWVDENTEFKIGKILKYRTQRGQKQALIRWLHWPARFDSWIPSTNIQDYKKS